MPREGYKTVTIQKGVYNKLLKRAKKTGRSIPKEIEYLVNGANPTILEDAQVVGEQKSKGA